jgi:phosphatidate cytidylyltransferase
MNEANRNLFVRILSALVLAPPLVASVMWQRPEGILGWALAATVIGSGEFYWITLKKDPVWLRVLGVVVSLGFALLVYYTPFASAPVAGLITAMLLFSILQLFFHQEIERAISNTALMAFGLLYVALPMASLAMIKRAPHGSEWIILLFCVTWFADTGAYAFGRMFGKHKLYEKISPKKSIEGAAGGVFVSYLGAVLAKFWYLPTLTWLDTVLIAVPGALLGMIGDLVESMIKRGYGVKDSGKAIPGHGGLLDRIDALLFVTPYVYLYVHFVVASR